MSNRDVFLQISIAALVCVCLFPFAVYSRTNERITDESKHSCRKSNATYDSYENYLSVRNAHAASKKKKIPQKGTTKKKKSYQTKYHSFGKIPAGAYALYTVRKGDTLTSIAKKNKVTVSTLRSANKLTNQNSIAKGMILKIPVKREPFSPSEKADFKAERIIALLNKPQFQWPIKNVIEYRNDGLNGVKPIGIIITAKPGSTVLSSASGTVRKIGRMRGFGNYIVMTHAGRYSTVYSNLDMILVTPGDTIQAGNAIGRISSTEQKIHFQIDREGKPENPLLYLLKKN